MGIINFLNAKYRDLRESTQYFRVPVEYTLKGPTLAAKRWVKEPSTPLQAGEKLKLKKAYSPIAHSVTPSFLVFERSTGEEIEAEVEEQTAARSLEPAAIASLNSKDSLLPHLYSSSAAERITAIDQLQKNPSEDPLILKALVELLQDDAQVVVMTSGTLKPVKEFAQAALVSMGRRAEPAVFEAWSQTDWVGNARLTRVLLKLQSDRAMACAGQIVQQKLPTPSLLLIEGLSLTGGDEALALLKELSSDPNPQVSEKAQAALSKRA